MAKPYLVQQLEKLQNNIAAAISKPIRLSFLVTADTNTNTCAFTAPTGLTSDDTLVYYNGILITDDHYDLVEENGDYTLSFTSEGKVNDTIEVIYFTSGEFNIVSSIEEDEY